MITLTDVEEMLSMVAGEPGVEVAAVVGQGFRINAPFTNVKKAEIASMITSGEPCWVDYRRIDG